MPHYDRSFDYGLRGPTRGFPRLEDYDREYRDRRALGARAPRVSAPYNLDYVFGGRGERYPRNYAPYGGEPGVPVRDVSEYRNPYYTISGSRTWRGTTGPRGYDLDFPRPGRGGRR